MTLNQIYVLVLVNLIVLVAIAYNIATIIMKLTELAATISAIDASVVSLDTNISLIATGVANLEATLANTELPAAAAAALTQLQTDVAKAQADTMAINSVLNPPAPPAIPITTSPVPTATIPSGTQTIGAITTT